MKRKRAYVILGMKRSGHHAIVHWIAYNWENAVHFNDCSSGWKQGLLAPSPNQGDGGKRVLFGKEPFEDAHVFNIEDFDIKNLNMIKNLKILSKYEKVYMCLVMRDPFNWIASSLKMGAGVSKNIKKRIDIYKQQAKVFQTNNITTINFNLWAKSQQYRCKLGGILDLPQIHKGVNITSKRGGGSSFDKMKYGGRANEMMILRRWEYYRKDPEYLKLIDCELCQISSKLFNFTVGLNSNKEDNNGKK